MYIHLGEDITVNDTTVMGIFDLENTTIGKDTRVYLERLGRAGCVVNVTQDLPKSFIVCFDLVDQTEKAYISSISVATLKKRANTMF